MRQCLDPNFGKNLGEGRESRGRSAEKPLPEALTVICCDQQPCEEHGGLGAVANGAKIARPSGTARALMAT